MAVNRTNPSSESRSRALILDLALIGLLIVGAYFRFIGANWGENQYLHPDERFLLFVGSAISPVQSLSEYFDTANSSLNPDNRGYNFFVYGTLPIFITRYAVEWISGHSGFNEVAAVGRPISAICDLLTLMLVYAVASRLYNRRVGIVAAAFYTAAVLPIQLSHFYKEDTFLNFFTFLAIYFAVRISKEWWPSGVANNDLTSQASHPADQPSGIKGQMSVEVLAGISAKVWHFGSNPLLYLSIGFGVAFGCAMASKLNALPVAFVLPAAVAIRLSSMPPEERRKHIWQALGYLVLAGAVSVLVFRLFQPYAFSGPGFFGIKPNPAWISGIRTQRNQAAGDLDFPPAMQWARRPVWFSGLNLTVWGLGLPFGMLAWVGFIWVGWRMLKGEWRMHALLWGWTAYYFIWQSIQSNPTMRYQLPIYPALAVLAGWAVIRLWDLGSNPDLSRGMRIFQRLFALVVGGTAILATFAYAFAFTRIYTRQITRLEASRWIYQNIPGPINLKIQTADGLYSQPLPFPYDGVIQAGLPYNVTFGARASGQLTHISLAHVSHQGSSSGPVEISVAVYDQADPAQPLAEASTTADLQESTDPRGDEVMLTLDQPVPVTKGQVFNLVFNLGPDGSAITLQGDAVANEGDWDDGIPYPIDGYNGFDGTYPQDVNFNMYWDDNPEKLERFLRILDQSDYIFITSNRQWGSLPRLPERFPLVTTYYRHLLGCPPEKEIPWCYTVARPGKFLGDMGFELVKVFQSDPTLGPLSLNDQFAEEAFTVYDHPKVLIFKKTDAYDPQQVREILGSVDLSQVIHVTPKKASSHPADLMLPEDRLNEQRQGGTWSELFNTQALQNRYQVVGVVVWYLSLFLLGLFAYPLLRMALPGLSDRGYPLARTAGLLIFSYLVWVAGSLRIPTTRLMITVVFLVLALGAGILAFFQRDELRQEWKAHRRYFLMIEGLFLAFFIFALLIRLGNPDLWHQWKGGERPMDFSYLNAVLKSTSFPPYDPWYAGGYLNYYYYGFVLVGVLIKWLGIVPSFAFNLVLPTVFSLIAMGAFSVAWNIFGKQGEQDKGQGTRDSVGGIDDPRLGTNDQGQRSLEPAADSVGQSVPIATPQSQPSHRHLRFWVALAAAFLMAVLGNLGTVRMITQGYQRLAAPGGVIEGTAATSRLVWTFQGVLKTLQGQSLPYSLGDWYWTPSRVMPPGDNAITEFPFFTFLYGDPHAHLFALPVALLALSWAVSLVLAHGRWKNLAGGVAGFLLGALAIGILYPINLSDIYSYLPLGVVALGYALWRNLSPTKIKGLSNMPASSQRLLVIAAAVILLGVLTVLLIKPYTLWYGQAYSSIESWKGPYTPWVSYITHWGLFLFLFATWFMWETRDWLVSTPLSALHKLKPYRELILAAIGLLLVAMLAHQWWALKNQWHGLSIAWLVLPLAAWAGALLLRPGLPDTKRIVLFLIGTGFLITMMVEVIVVRGDIGRQNTVFKFYLQAWTFFSVCGAVIVGWMVRALPEWRPGWRLAWQVPLVFLVACTALFTLFGGLGKIRDRMFTGVPLTLDGMDYMQYATYEESGVNMDLSQDYRLIRWMQENIPGSPVIVEANSRDLYRWYTRNTIYTGLPGVVGWEWHQQQQRALLPPNWVTDRVQEINSFYQTVDPEQARAFLEKYAVRYIVVGQLEKATYPGPGLEKFPLLEGTLWRTVYHDQDTTLYEVIK